MRHTRVPEVLGTEALAAIAPSLVAPSCDETVPALLYNRSFGR